MSREVRNVRASAGSPPADARHSSNRIPISFRCRALVSYCFLPSLTIAMTFSCLTCHAELDDSYKSCPRCGNQISDFVREYSGKPVNGTYELLGRIRGGGMGEVFRARHLIFGTDFIIKVMKPTLRDNASLQKRFIREALLSRKVRQANVATVADA